MVNHERSGTELIIALSLVILVALGEWLGLFRSLRSFGERVLMPSTVLTTQKLNKVVQPWRAWMQGRHAAESLQELEALYSQALAKISQLENLEAENIELRGLMEAQNRPQTAVITSPVISYGLPSINVGELDGVVVGQPVLAAQTLIGTIKEVSAHQAQLSLLGQLQSPPILAETQNGEKGMIVGDGKRIILTELSREAQVVIGDRVMTSGQPQIRPRLLIGQVSQIIDQPTAPVLQVVVEPVVSFYEATILEIWP